MKKILVIDDEDMIIDVISTILSDMGYEVVGHQDPGDGIKAARETDFDIVLCDLRMPGTNGAEVTEAIMAEKPDTKILIITAYPADPLARRALDAGAVSLLKKPFEVAKVLDFLRD